MKGEDDAETSVIPSSLSLDYLDRLLWEFSFAFLHVRSILKYNEIKKKQYHFFFSLVLFFSSSSSSLTPPKGMCVCV